VKGTAPDGAYPMMEGTSGAAERLVLRGTSREAALGGERRVSGGRRADSENTGSSQTRRPDAVGTPTCDVTSLRQEVSEPIGLGQSSLRERSRWGGAKALWGESTRALVSDP
jgi:hypothetical protein